MTDRRRFQVVPPDWGEAHLTLEAVVAYVDDELAAGPQDRAVRHLGRCAGCAAEVAEQRRARSALRGADAPTLPPSLMTALRAIPQDTELPAPPAGLALSDDGELVSILRPAAIPGAACSDTTAPAAVDPVAADPGSGPAGRSRRSRRVRLGTGAAVSGLALGALAFGLPAVTANAPAPGPSGPAPGSPVVARLAVNPAQPARPRSGIGTASSAAPAAPTASAPGAPAVPGPTPMRTAGLPPSG
ncbi:anti-sigma factor family protein [Pseudonocardia nantongensis]|uniref:anti-sigma factor family protein n=1 Tax=Pseudonocardia nantongensis TaxID=1181885 RepID=UPI00397DBDF1